ncbi:MAG: hypothetical protein AB9861_04820 [Methanosarcina sp.]
MENVICRDLRGIMGMASASRNSGTTGFLPNRLFGGGRCRMDMGVNTNRKCNSLLKTVGNYKTSRINSY